MSTPSWHHRIPWRSLIATLSLPMLALSASFGVFDFSQLFSPMWVSFANAAAFEWVYLGLAVAEISDAQRGRATLIARAAVLVSILDNFVAGLFHLHPELRPNLPVWSGILLSLLHSVPLGVLAYATSDLLIHAPRPTNETTIQPPTILVPPALPLPHPPPEPTYACPSCAAPLRKAEFGAAKRYGYCSSCKGAGKQRDPEVLLTGDKSHE